MSATIIIRTDEDVKTACEELYKKLGLNLSSAINTFLRASLRSNGLPFQLIDETHYFNKKTLNAFAEGDKLTKSKTSKGNKSTKDLKRALGV